MHRKNDQLQHVSETHQLYDALQYIILFWQDEDDKCSCKKFTGVTGNENNHILKCRPLFHQYVLDRYFKVETERLTFIYEVEPGKTPFIGKYSSAWRHQCSRKWRECRLNVYSFSDIRWMFKTNAGVRPRCYFVYHVQVQFTKNLAIIFSWPTTQCSFSGTK